MQEQDDQITKQSDKFFIQFVSSGILKVAKYKHNNNSNVLTGRDTSSKKSKKRKIDVRKLVSNHNDDWVFSWTQGSDKKHVSATSAWCQSSRLLGLCVQILSFLLFRKPKYYSVSMHRGSGYDSFFASFC